MRTSLFVPVLVSAIVSSLAAPVPQTLAGTPIAGFDDSLVVGGLDTPTGIAFLPDGRLLVTELGGKLKLVSGGTATTLITVPVCLDEEMGLIDVAVDPSFGSNGFLYAYRTENNGGCASAAGRSNEVVRLTMAPNDTISPGTLTVLLTGIQTDNGNHDGGCMRIGPDGKLYVGVGDTGVGDNRGGPGSSTNPYSQDLAHLEGKILRLNLDGSVPGDNPFVGQAGKRAEIWAYGFRNPWRFGFDPLTGKLWLGDVGDFTYEEIDIVTAGGNYAWPHCEAVQPGGCHQPGDIDPIFVYPHSGGGVLGTSITGGAFAPVSFGSFGQDYFFADFTGDTVYQASLNGARSDIASVSTFVTSAGNPVDLIFGADGALYYVAIGVGQVRKVALAAGPSEQLLSGRKLQLKDAPDVTRKKLHVLSKDTGVGLGGSSADPTVAGGSLRVVGAGFDDTYPLPPGGWTFAGDPADGKGFLYKDRFLANGPVKLVQVKTGKLVRVEGKGAGLGHTLAADPSPVDAVLTIGVRTYCMHFGGTTIFTAGKSFTAKDAGTSPACP